MRVVIKASNPTTEWKIVRITVTKDKVYYTLVKFGKTLTASEDELPEDFNIPEEIKCHTEELKTIISEESK